MIPEDLPGRYEAIRSQWGTVYLDFLYPQIEASIWVQLRHYIAARLYLHQWNRQAGFVHREVSARWQARKPSVKSHLPHYQTLGFEALDLPTHVFHGFVNSRKPPFAYSIVSQNHTMLPR